MSQKLDQLPKSDDEYWEHAETINIELKEVPKCEHHFVRTTGKHVECRCGVGFYITPTMEVKGGSIYEDDFLII